MPTPFKSQWTPCLPLAAGLLALYLPTLYDLLTGIWSTDGQMHGPIVLCISLWLLYRNRGAMEKAATVRASNRWGWPLLVIGLLLYALGRSQDLALLEVGSSIGLLVALILLLRGAAALKAQWFTLFFALFMVPLPEAVVAAVTLPMKLAVSQVVEYLLFWLDYPVARTGVMLQVGQYMLLVADACAGLHTLLTLEALGLLYLNLVRHTSVLRNVGLAVSIAPISFLSNVIRVLILCLITYHFGDAAGQGFLHVFAGMVLFLSALILIMGMDAVIQKLGGVPASTPLHAGGSAA